MPLNKSLGRQKKYAVKRAMTTPATILDRSFFLIDYSVTFAVPEAVLALM